MVRMRSDWNQKFAAAEGVSGGKPLRSQIASAPDTRKQAPVKRVKPSGIAPRR